MYSPHLPNIYAQHPQLWMIVFHFPPLTYKGQKGETGKNVHSISQTPPHEILKCVKDCFLFLPYDLLVWWPRRQRSTRWDHSQGHALHTHSVICFCTLVSEGSYMVHVIIWECKTHAHTHTHLCPPLTKLSLLSSQCSLLQVYPPISPVLPFLCLLFTRTKITFLIQPLP